MGLAASQARFLGLTARKANCEFKSTELAEEKLDLTNQLSQISNDYYDAMNATKLVWQSDVVDGSYGVSYGLLMSPSALNDYNPYMVTSRSGAIVLTDEFAKAAQAAGISMGGGSASALGRDIFINNLIESGIITEETAKLITNYDYDKNADNKTSKVSDVSKDEDANKSSGVKSKSTGYITYDPAAGVGGVVINKNEVDGMNISDLMLSDAIGKQSIGLGTGKIGGSSLTTKYNSAKTDEEKAALIDYYKLSDDDKKKLENGDILSGSYTAMNDKEYNNKISDLDSKIKTNKAAYESAGFDVDKYNEYKSYISNHSAAYSERQTYDNYSAFIAANQSAYDNGTLTAAQRQQFEEYKSYVDAHKDNLMSDSDKSTYESYSNYINSMDSAKTAYENYIKYSEEKSALESVYIYSPLKISTGQSTINETQGYCTLIENGSVVSSQGTIHNMTVADLLSDNVVLLLRSKENKDSTGVTTSDFANAVMEIMRPVFEILGYGDTTHKIGLNIDDASNEALNYAFNMIQNVYLRPSNTYNQEGDKTDNTPSKNSAYTNATKTNRIAQDENGIYTAVSLSNIMSAFLTYFGNYTLAEEGEDSNFSVGKMVDISKYVTEDSGYIYYGQSTEYTLSTEDKIADFYDQLYNNLCKHGWRQDDTLNNDENLIAAIQDGRYTLSALHDDGYFYQTNYLNIDYLTEVTDDDAISRAEADYSRKKAEITYKENAIDIKTKKLDAEIAAINQEINSVSNLIQDGVKVFDMFKS